MALMVLLPFKLWLRSLQVFQQLIQAWPGNYGIVPELLWLVQVGHNKTIAVE
jgi:hypothetical protein